MTLAVGSRNDYVGTGLVDTFAYDFKIFAASDLQVTVLGVNNGETTLAYPADFDVEGVGLSNGGSITLAAGALTSGYLLTIRRVVALEQNTVMRNQQGFFPETQEAKADYLTMIAQQQQDALDRCVRVPVTTSPDIFDTQLPAPQALRYLRYNADASALEAIGPLPSEDRRINVMDFGAVGDGVHDDAPAVQLAVNFIKSLRQLISGAQQFIYPGVLYYPPGHVYLQNFEIDMQAIQGWGWGIEALGSVILGHHGGFPVFNFRGSAYGIFNGVTVLGGKNGTDTPYCAFLYGRLTTTGQPAGGHVFLYPKLDGYFSMTGFMNQGSEGCLLVHPICHNMNPATSMSMIIDGLHHLVVPTNFLQSEWITDTPDSCIQHEVQNCDFSGTGVGPAILLIECHQVRIGGYATSSGDCAVQYLSRGGQNPWDIEIRVHVEMLPLSNFQGDTLTAGPQSFNGLVVRDHASTATGSIISAGATVTDLQVVSGEVFFGPYSGVNPVAAGAKVTLGPYVKVNGANLKSYGYAFQILDDAAASFTMPGFSPMAVIIVASAINGGNHSAMVAVRANGAPFAQAIGSATGSAVNLATGILAGTTGVDGKTTISAHTDGKIYIENRSGVTDQITVFLTGL